MATYISSSMHGSGSLGEALSGTKTFTITNFTNSLGQYPVGYLVLQGNPSTNSNLQQYSSTKVPMSGSFGGFADGAEEINLVVNEYEWGISISENRAEFTFTPASPISANKYIIKATGNFNLTIS